MVFQSISNFAVDFFLQNLVGKVEVTVSQLTYTGRILDNNSSNIASKFTEATVDLNSGAASKKKNLRSGMGTATVASSSVSKHESVVGARLDTSTYFWF